jgi:hypothetical protein
MQESVPMNLIFRGLLVDVKYYAVGHGGDYGVEA